MKIRSDSYTMLNESLVYFSQLNFGYNKENPLICYLISSNSYFVTTNIFILLLLMYHVLGNIWTWSSKS